MCVVKCTYTCRAWLPCAAHIIVVMLKATSIVSLALKKTCGAPFGTPKLDI